MISRAHNLKCLESVHKKFVFLTTMEDKRIEELVQEVFKKAEKESASHSRFALSKHIEQRTDLSSKTLERAHHKYVTKTYVNYQLHAESINILCQYLGFENFQEYVNERHFKTSTNIQGEPRLSPIKRSHNFWIAIGSLLTIVTIVIFWSNKNGNTTNDVNCMTWADSLYIPIACDTGPVSKNGAPVIPLDPVKLKNFKKVQVSMATQFFSEETENPLIWYYTKSKDETEYYTAPGLHPITGKTLKAITEHIIMTRIPMHTDREGSYLKE